MTEAPDEFVPLNTLEEKLIQAKTGQLPVEELMNEFARSQVAVMVDQPLKGDIMPEGVRPLVLQNSENHYALAMFTDLERTKIMAGQVDPFNYVLLVEFNWIISISPQGIGVIVNPGWDACMEMGPGNVEELKSKLKTDESNDS